MFETVNFAVLSLGLKVSFVWFCVISPNEIEFLYALPRPVNVIFGS